MPPPFNPAKKTSVTNPFPPAPNTPTPPVKSEPPLGSSGTGAPAPSAVLNVVPPATQTPGADAQAAAAQAAAQAAAAQAAAQAAAAQAAAQAAAAQAAAAQAAAQAAAAQAAASTALPATPTPIPITPSKSQPVVNSQPQTQLQVAAPTTPATSAPPSSLPTKTIPATALAPVPQSTTTTSNSQVCLTCTTPQNTNTGTTTPSSITEAFSPVAALPTIASAPAAPLAAPAVSQPTPLVPNPVQCTTTLNVLGEGISFSQTVKQYKIGKSLEINASVKLLNTDALLQALSTGKSQPLDLTQILQIHGSNNNSGLMPNLLPIFTQAAISALTAGQELLAGNLAGAGEKLIKPFCDAKLPSAQNAILTLIGVAGSQKALGGKGISLSPQQTQILSAAINSNNNQQMPMGTYFRSTLPYPVLQINQFKSNAPAYRNPSNTPAKVTTTGGTSFGAGISVEAGTSVPGGGQLNVYVRPQVAPGQKVRVEAGANLTFGKNNAVNAYINREASRGAVQGGIFIDVFKLFQPSKPPR